MHLEKGVKRKRCGFVGQKQPVRQGSRLFEKLPDGTPGNQVGEVTSGTFGPTIGRAVGMAFVNTPFNKFNTELLAQVRTKYEPVTIAKMPFVKPNYYKKP